MSGRGTINLHGIIVTICTALALFLFVYLIFAFALNVNAAILGHLVLLLIVTMSVLVLALNASHLVVFALYFGGRFISSIFGSLLLGFLSTVFFLVRNKVGLGLLRREFRGRRGVRVPIGSSIRICRLLCGAGYLLTI